MERTEETEEALCVRLAAGAGTDPEILRALAREGPVTVRAAVAMNLAAPADVNQSLALDADERVRALLAGKLARLDDRDPGTLAVLAEDPASRVRVAIADVVKQMVDAPHALVLHLARDALVAISDPVIRLSPILTSGDLLNLLAFPPSVTVAVSVAQRPNLSEVISDAITATADSAAIRALLSNPSAAIREATLDALIAIAPAHIDWHSPLVHRPVLPPRAVRALGKIVATHLLETLANRPDMDPSLAAELRHRLEDRLAGTQAEQQIQGLLIPTNLTAVQAMDEAYSMRANGQLTEDAVIAVVQRGEARLAAAMLAAAADVPMSVVDRAGSLRSAKGLISLVWEAGFSMRAAGPLQAMLAHLAPSAILPAGAGGAFPLATEEMRWQLNFLKRMGR